MRLRLGVMLLAVLAAALVWSGSASAQNNQANAPFVLAPNGKATIDFESFCIDYGKRFPDRVGLPPSSVADAAVVGVLSNALSQGATSSNPREVQFAIWQARGASGAPQPGDLGRQLAQNIQPPTPPQGATSLIDALNNDQITVTAGSWQGIGEQLTINNFQDYFQGRGQITIENISDQQLTLYMPIGTVFPAPAAEFQNMAGYATNVAVDNPETMLSDTGISDWNNTQLLLAVFLALDIAAMGLLIQRRSRPQA